MKVIKKISIVVVFLLTTLIASGLNIKAKTRLSTVLKKAPADWFKTAIARQTADRIVGSQQNDGGWRKSLYYFSDKFIYPPAYPVNPKRTIQYSTFDNGATVNEMIFLGEVYKTSKKTKYLKALIKGLNFIFSSQYGSGGWPQAPSLSGYHRNITFNDYAMVNIMILLYKVSKRKPPFDFLPEELRKKAEKSFKLGLACILKCQFSQNGKLTGWSQQYDPITLKPASGRSFEKKGICSAETASIISLLISIKKPSKAVINSVNNAVSWLKSVAIKKHKLQKYKVNYGRGFDVRLVKDKNAPRIWARYYDINSNKPFFCGRDGVKKYDIQNISVERRTGYSWYGFWPDRFNAMLKKRVPEWRKNLQKN